MSYPPPLPTSAHALKPQSWPFDAALLPAEAHLVGGSVRDALLHRQADYLDLDFVMPQHAIATASRIAKRYQAGFVVLDEENQIARAVFEQATIDLAQQVGPTLESDLQRRDFTINAIAYHPPTDQLIDPLDGIGDLKQQTLRMVSPGNLAEDPLRLLRAYRQAAQLGFNIDAATRQTIRQLAPRLKTMAAERVRHELDALLSKPQGTQYLQLAYEDGLLIDWLPQLTARHFQTLTAVDQAVDAFAGRPDHYQDLWGWPQAVPPGHYRSWVKVAKLSQLVGPREAEAERLLSTLKYSRSETQAVLKVLSGQAYLADATQNKTSETGEGLEDTLARDVQFFFFKRLGPCFTATSAVAVAHGYPMEKMDALVDRYQNPDDPVAHPQPLVTGRVLMQVLGLKPGPKIGKLLTAIEQQQAKGAVTTADEALAWAQTQGL